MNLNDQIAGGLPWCVAGGYAVCPQLASDMDVWVLAGNNAFLGAVAFDICVRVPGIVPAQDSPDAPPYIHDNRTLRVGTLGHRHIMVTSCASIQELLDCFDISTHQCALDENGEFTKGRAWTPITEPPVQLMDTPNTRNRMAKIGARYAPFRMVAA